MVTVATVDEQVKLSRKQREILMAIWAALRGVGMGAQIDMDYAKKLAEALWESCLADDSNG